MTQLNDITDGSALDLFEGPELEPDYPEPGDRNAPNIPYDWDWRSLTEFAELPPPVTVVDGLLIEGAITMLYAPQKTGKSRLLMGLIKSLSPGGPLFCDMRLVPTPTLLFTEEPPNVLGQRVRDFAITAASHKANYAAALVKDPADFAQEVYTAYHQLGGDFGLVVVDTLASFVNIQEINSYSETGHAMAAIRQVIRDLPNVAFLLLHHSSKAGGDRWASALGSTALTAQADQLMRLSLQNGKHSVTVGGRYDCGPFGWDEANTIGISTDGVVLLGKAEDAHDDSVLAMLQTMVEPTTVKALAGQLDTLSSDIVRKAIKRLCANGDLREIEPAAGKRPATYQI